jgi:hypothetical protein
MAKTAVAHCGRNSVEINASSQVSRIAASALAILTRTDPAKLLGKLGIGPSEIVLRCRFNSDSSILLIQTMERGLTLSKNLT